MQSRTSVMPMLNKVPEITIWFWIIKVLATTVGETAADFLNVNLHFGLSGTALFMTALLAVFLFVQIRARACVQWIYWVAVVLISVVGTLITDYLVDTLGVPLEATTLAFAVALAATFFAWYYLERTLSIRAITNLRRELFYWAAILFTFALGTAGGDLMAEGLSLGYGISALWFAGLIAVVAVAHYALGANSIATFWTAYILTRPLGASCGDLLSQPVTAGGLGLGASVTSATFLLIILVLVSYLTALQRRLAAPGRRQEHSS